MFKKITYHTEYNSIGFLHLKPTNKKSSPKIELDEKIL